MTFPRMLSSRRWLFDHIPTASEPTEGAAIEQYDQAILITNGDIYLCTDATPNALIWVKSGIAAFADEDQFIIPGTLLNAPYFLIQKVKYAGIINSFTASCTSLLTAGTYTVKINGTNVTGLTTVTNTVSSTETNATANNIFVVGDIITITFANSLTLLNFQGQLSTTRS